MRKANKNAKNWLNLCKNIIYRLISIVFPLICALGLVGLVNQIEIINPEVLPKNESNEI